MHRAARNRWFADSPLEGTGFEPSVPPSSIGHSDVSHRFPNGSGGDWSHSRKPALGVPLARLTRIRISPIVFRLDVRGRQVAMAKLRVDHAVASNTQKSPPRRRGAAVPETPPTSSVRAASSLRTTARSAWRHAGVSACAFAVFTRRIARLRVRGARATVWGAVHLALSRTLGVQIASGPVLPREA